MNKTKIAALMLSATFASGAFAAWDNHDGTMTFTGDSKKRCGLTINSDSGAISINGNSATPLSLTVLKNFTGDFSLSVASIDYTGQDGITSANVEDFFDIAFLNSGNPLTKAGDGTIVIPDGSFTNNTTDIDVSVTVPSDVVLDEGSHSVVINYEISCLGGAA